MDDLDELTVLSAAAFAGNPLWSAVFQIKDKV